MSLWDALDSLESRGSQAEKAGSLGALHAKRKETLSQFFTPSWVVSFIWESIKPAFDESKYYSLFDNSIGAASMFRCANPDQFSINGLDVDSDLVQSVSKVLDDSGFTIDLCNVGMEQADLWRYSAALINPPFSIPLSSPFLTPYKGVTHYGKLGADTSALSHEYALVQALENCDIVAAVVPRSTTNKLNEITEHHTRLMAVYQLPNDCFSDENVKNVRVDLLIFGSMQNTYTNEKVIYEVIDSKSIAVPLKNICCRSEQALSTRAISVIGSDNTAPVITIPATADKRVVLTRAGRNIKLKFADGATQAKVLNALYDTRLYSTNGHRYPAKTKYSGQYKLNIDTLLLQNCPFEALDKVMAQISAAGGRPILDQNLFYGIRSLLKEHKKMSMPFGRTVYRKQSPSFNATAKKMSLLNSHQRGAVVAMGEVVTATRNEAGFSIKSERGVFDCEHDKFFSIFEPEASAMSQCYWEEITPPIKNSFPQEIKSLETKAKQLGLDKWLDLDFQFEDLCELAFKPKGAICGWQMALGKTRLALALALLSPGNTLIIVKSRLVNELEREMEVLGLDKTEVNTIRCEADTRDLKKINLVSYERIKRPLNKRFPKITLARRLKNRVDTIIADEGGVLANENSQQTREIIRIGAQKTYIFDGTPCPNYPREMLALACRVAGQERSYQPYSIGNKGYIYTDLFHCAHEQPTGRNSFLNDFICFDWATNEFLDTGKGAKREIPKIKAEGIPVFRRWVSSFIKRRVQQEPAVTKHIDFPVPTLHPPITLDWDFEHLVLYIKAVEDFARWYEEYTKQMQLSQKGLNLTMILARLEACFKAANVPSTVSGFASPYHKQTSKERACVDLIKQEVEKGRRPIVFARNPSALKRLSGYLNDLGITNLVFTGEDTIAKRTKKLNEQIREGDVQVLLASIGVTQDGLNLHQLNTFIFYNRSYKAREEFQGIYRLIRPQQKDDVYGYFLHLQGSIDEYMGQLIEWKALASEAGLDYGEQPDDEEFIHFDAFIYSFLESLPALKEKLKETKQQKAA